IPARIPARCRDPRDPRERRAVVEPQSPAAAVAAEAVWGQVEHPAAGAAAGAGAWQPAVVVDVTAAEGARFAALPEVSFAAPAAEGDGAAAMAEIPLVASRAAVRGPRQLPEVPLPAPAAAAAIASALEWRHTRRAAADAAEHARAAAESARTAGDAADAAPAATGRAAAAQVARPRREVSLSLFPAHAPYDHRHVAHIHAPGRHLEPLLMPIAPRFHPSGPGSGVGPHLLERRALRLRNIGRDAYGLDRNARLRLVVETQVAISPRQSG